MVRPQQDQMPGFRACARWVAGFYRVIRPWLLPLICFAHQIPNSTFKMWWEAAGKWNRVVSKPREHDLLRGSSWWCWVLAGLDWRLFFFNIVIFKGNYLKSGLDVNIDLGGIQKDDAQKRITVLVRNLSGQTSTLLAWISLYSRQHRPYQILVAPSRCLLGNGTSYIFPLGPNPVCF